MLRKFSSWVVSSGSKPTTSMNVEQLFTDNRVQALLKKLCGLSTTKMFHFRPTTTPERPTYRLMTDKEYNLMREEVTQHATERLQIPPFKAAHLSQTKVIVHDADIAGFDNANFLFLDISPDVKHRDRLVVVREPNGVLRSGTNDEHDRLVRTYFPAESRPVVEPTVFKDPHLTAALNDGKYELILDWACWYFEPDDPDYIKVASTAYSHIDSTKSYETVWSTRHHGALVFYLVINNRIDNLLDTLIQQRRIGDAADTVRLYCICHSSSKLKDTNDDLKLVKAFVNAYSKNRQSLLNLLSAYEEETLQSASGSMATASKST